MKQICYKGLKFEPYIENQAIKNRIKELGEQITKDCQGTVPLFICVLNGAFPFAADLIREVGIDAEIMFIRLKSYEGTSSTGNVKEILGLTEPLEGRTVIVVEDIVDTGKTIRPNLSSPLSSSSPSPCSAMCVPITWVLKSLQNSLSASVWILTAWPAIFPTSGL